MCLCQGADLHMAQLIPLPLTISCSSQFRLVLLPGTGSTQVSRYQKGKTNLDSLEQEIVSGSGIR